MSQHLVACSCGRQLPVELSQAGQDLRCECGSTVTVPTFRQLRELPIATADAAKPVAVTRKWGARQGTIAACLIFAGLFVLGAAASRFTEPQLPQFHPEARNQQVSNEIDKLSPADAWKVWTENYRQLAYTGFAPMQHELTDIIQQVIDQHRRIQFALAVLAAICGVVAFIVFAIPARSMAH
jgi:hypothetical protein